MKTYDFTPIGVIAIAIMAVTGQQLIFDLIGMSPPPTWALVFNFCLGVGAFFLDAVIIGVVRGMRWPRE